MIIRNNIDIYNVNCMDHMQSIQADSVDLVVTSPPYDNLREYGSDNPDSWNFDVFKQVANGLYRVVKPCGVVVWIVSDATINGSETGTSFRQALYFMDIGFNLHDTMIWNKASATHPERRRYYHSFEYMFVFVKSPDGGVCDITANLLKDRKNEWSHMPVAGTKRKADGSTKYFSKGVKGNEYGVRFNVWTQTCARGSELTGHPAQMPIQLARDHIETWSNSGDTIFDPFMGSGTTAIACLDTNRKFIGCEINPEYFEISRKRIGNHMVTRRLF